MLQDDGSVVIALADAGGVEEDRVAGEYAGAWDKALGCILFYQRETKLDQW